MEEHSALDLLGALAQETRLRMVRYLVHCGEAGAPAGEIAREVEASSSRAAFHLAALERAGAVTSMRRSRQIVYRADLEGLGALISFLLNDCCDGHPDILACCAPRR